jgi:hypothetical protein
MKYAFSLLLLMGLACCKPASDKENPNMSSSLLSADSVNEPAKTVLAFLNWYKANEKTIQNINLVKNMGDTTKVYAIDFKETDAYLKALQQSGFISDKYLATQRKYFTQCDANFKKNRQNEGPPDGMDFNLVMLSQDYEHALSQLEKAKVITCIISVKKAMVIIEFSDKSKLRYFLDWKNPKWAIESIHTEDTL